MTPQQEYAQRFLNDIALAGVIFVILLITIVIGSMIYSHFQNKKTPETLENQNESISNTTQKRE